MTFKVPPEALRRACEAAVSELDLSTLEEDLAVIRSREKVRFDAYNPVDIELLFDEGPEGIDLQIKAENEGVGPYQEHHVKAKVQDLMSRIRIELERYEDDLPANDPGIIMNELRMLSELRSKGVITDIEYMRAKERLLDPYKP